MITRKSREELYMDKLIKNLNYYKFVQIGDMIVMNDPERRFKTFLLPHLRIVLFLSTFQKRLIDDRMYFECFDDKNTSFVCVYINTVLALEHCIIRKRFNINRDWGAFPRLKFNTRRFGESFSTNLICEEWIESLSEPYKQEFKEIHLLHMLAMNSGKHYLESKYNTLCDPYVHCIDVN